MTENQKMTQLNVRIPLRLKEEGTSALDSIGLTPSAAVRALWEKAARRGKDLEELSRMLVGESEEPSSGTADDVAANGHALWDEYLGEVNHDG